MAAKELLGRGYEMIPIRPGLDGLLGAKAYATLDEARDAGRTIDTVTMYVGPEASQAMSEALIRLQPRRVIFNPGAENAALAEQLEKNGIEALEACTLVLLRTGQF